MDSLNVMLKTLYNGGEITVSTYDEVLNILKRIELDEWDRTNCRGIVIGGCTPWHMKLVFWEDNDES